MRWLILTADKDIWKWKWSSQLNNHALIFSHIFACLSLTRDPQYLRAWNRLVNIKQFGPCLWKWRILSKFYLNDSLVKISFYLYRKSLDWSKYSLEAGAIVFFCRYLSEFVSQVGSRNIFWNSKCAVDARARCPSTVLAWPILMWT